MRERRGQERIAGIPGVIGYDEWGDYSNDEEGRQDTKTDKRSSAHPDLM